MTTSRSSCFICLEQESPEGGTTFKRLCQTCLESTICQRCEERALHNTSNPDVLTNCPICRRQIPSNVIVDKIVLISHWQSIVFVTWLICGITAPVWQCALVLFMMNVFLSGLSRKINSKLDNGRPSMFIRRFKLLNLLIHIPYLVLLGFFDHHPLNADLAFNAYLFSHVGFPVSLFFLGKLLQIL